jgi:phospholipid/cholesterol/gamma-HCH transport system permease protein
VTRELAPLITAILVAGRVGSAMAAELGTMKVSEEIDALKVIGIDPVSFLVLPRLIGLGIALPCLTILGDLLGILGGLVVAVSVLGVPAGGYLRDCLDALAMEDVWGGLLKAALFAVVIGLICCERGMSTSGGAAQVGRSTTSAVVRSIVFIIVVDLVVTALLYVN